MFSILIPTWNNLPYLKLCIESIEKNSFYKNELILHVNQGSDGTLAWVKEKGFKFTFSSENVGICLAMNGIAKLATCEYLAYVNDDMYCLPHWDKFIADEIKLAGDKEFMFSATMIEPRETSNECAIVENFGTTWQEFDADRLEREYIKLTKQDWNGAYWPPNVIRKSTWEKLGGYDEAFSPGMGSDDDFVIRMWKNGCRLFKGIANSRVYHFSCVTTSRIKKNNARRQILLKHKIAKGLFHKYYLRRGSQFEGDLPEPEKDVWFYLANTKYFIKNVIFGL